jgi:PAS domain S-box-containing protein
VVIVWLLAYLYRLHAMKRLLLQAKEDWEESFNTINEAITVHDLDCTIIQANRTAREAFGEPLLALLTRRCMTLRREIEGNGTEDSRPMKGAGITEELFEPGMERYLEIKSFLRFDGRHRPAGMVQIVRDISERRRGEKERQIMQSQLIEAQKMEAMGTLAGGIAHDFNNILAAVLGYTELSLHDTPEGSRLRDRLQQLLKASLRAKELVDQILAFSRQSRGESHPRPVQIRLIIKEALKLLRSTFPSTIEIRQNIASSQSVMIDPTQMHQIIMNLCTNAKHAMEANGGILTVELIDEDVGVAPDLSDAHLHLQPGDRKGHGPRHVA